MQKTVIMAVWLVVSTNFSIAQRALPTEESLIVAWETLQRSDPATLKLEKTAERSYRFHTNRFPFDGELEVLTIIMEEGVEFDDPGYIQGTVEVELVGFGTEMIQKYGRSYGYWLQNNTLFYDLKTGAWRSAKEYRAELSRKYDYSSPLWTDLSQYFWLIFLAILCAILLWVSKKSARQMAKAQSWQDEAMELSKKGLALSEKSVQLVEKSIEIHEETNLVLNKILQRLEEKAR